MKHYAFVCLCATALLYGCKDKTPTGWSDSTPVEIIVVDDGSTPTERNYVGDVGSEKELSLTFPLGGTLTKAAVKNGEYVTKGQLIAEVDATTAKSLHATALATLRQAEDAYRRLEAVHREGGISEVKWVEMETNLEKARQAEVTARKHKEDCSIRAPFSGVVSCGSHSVGQEMKPGETYCRILDMNRLQIQFSVPEQEISLINIGDTATAVVPSMGDGEITLCIKDKSLSANPLGHTYKVFAKMISGNTKKLLPDMVAKVHAKLNALGGIVVPADCVQTMPEGIIVWVLKDGKAQHRSVTVGDFVHNGVIVKEGLAAGDTVVTVGYQKLYTGAKVTVKE